MISIFCKFLFIILVVCLMQKIYYEKKSENWIKIEQEGCFQLQIG